jgi:LAS superfamily LD-carboxypeptidase LdcB
MHSVALFLLTLPAVAQADLQMLRGKFQPEKRAGFKVVPAKYSPGRVEYLDERALIAFEKMAAAAEQAGFQLRIISATRNFTTQKAIWEQKFSGIRKVRGKDLSKTLPNEEQRALEILKYSSMPGTSRHHWGTDLDLHEAKLSGPALSNETLSKGRGLKLYNWLLEHAGQYGFCQPYKGAPTARNHGLYAHGYEEERWHWSYRPVAAEYLKAYTQHAADLIPRGFLGDKSGAKYYLDYVKNIDPGCL